MASKARTARKGDRWPDGSLRKRPASLIVLFYSYIDFNEEITLRVHCAIVFKIMQINQSLNIIRNNICVFYNLIHLSDVTR